MIAYLDSSVILRILFQEKSPLKSFSTIKRSVSSRLLRTECFRTVDRHRLKNKLSSRDFLQHLQWLDRLLETVALIEITPSILQHAAQSLPVPLGTLDSIHLSTCLGYQEMAGESVTLCSHDLQLLHAAQYMGLAVRG